ncbi:hypothetical protein CH356_03810 [Listeria monocytogenes]|nr:hypothetical protein [Listeria monocytogenes]
MELTYEIEENKYSVLGVRKDSEFKMDEELKSVLSTGNYVCIIDSSVHDIMSECFSENCVYVQYKGEENKNLEYASLIMTEILKYSVNRDTTIIVVGGGGLSDLVGYISNQIMRGLHWIQVPTTLMSMLDCVVGKVAINFAGRKNILGHFASPSKVIIDLDLLVNMPDYLIKEGLVEAIKCGFIFKDYELIEKVKIYLKTKEISELDLIIKRSIELKIGVVRRDFNDKKNYQKAVSYGHTFANALEELKLGNHSEAVLYGMLIAAIISTNRGYITESELKEHIKFIRVLNFKNKIQFSSIDKEHFINKMRLDKIAKNNELYAVLLNDISYSIEKINKNEIELALEMAVQILE